MAARLKLMVLRGLDQEPMVVISCGLAAIGVAAVMVGPPVRRALGYDTSHFYGPDLREERAAVTRGREAVYERSGLASNPKLKSRE